MDEQDFILVFLKDVRVCLTLLDQGVFVKIWRENEPEPEGGLLLPFKK